MSNGTGGGGGTFTLRNLFQDVTSVDQDPNTALGLGDNSEAFVYVNVAQISGTQTLEFLTSARNRQSDYFTVKTFVFTTTTTTYAYLTQLGRYLRTKSRIGPGDSVTWESLVVPTAS
jgi:hypothetical protein